MEAQVAAPVSSPSIEYVIKNNYCQILRQFSFPLLTLSDKPFVG